MPLPSGIRTEAKQGSATSSDFQSLVSVPEADDTNAFARVVRERRNHEARDFDAEGEALGALRVRLGLETPTSQSARVGLREVEFPGPDDEEGGWQSPLRLWPGSYTLHAAADHPSGLFTANSQSTFVIERQMLEVVTTHDEEGNVISRVWMLGLQSVRVQMLKWDGQGRLIAVVDRNANDDGYDWSARYDGLGRRLGTTTQTVREDVPQGRAFEEGSWYDPLVEFLEIAVETREVGLTNSAKRTWKVHGPDADGSYGGLQGIVGLEALVDEGDGTFTALVDDYYGHIIASVDGGTGVAAWSVTRSQSYGPSPDSPTFTLSSGGTLAQATAWRGRRADVTGFHYLGARYFESTDGRFLSTDPLGHGASMDLYSFAGGDPVNFVDPTGRYQKAYWRHNPGERRFSHGELPSGFQDVYMLPSGSIKPSLFEHHEPEQVIHNEFFRGQAYRDGTVSKDEFLVTFNIQKKAYLEAKAEGQAKLKEFLDANENSLYWGNIGVELLNYLERAFLGSERRQKISWDADAGDYRISYPSRDVGIGTQLWSVLEIGSLAIPPTRAAAGMYWSARSTVYVERAMILRTATKGGLRQTGAGGFAGSADEAYAAIRASTDDVAAIAGHTGIKPSNIQKVKDHIFYKEHLLDRYVDHGVPAYMGRFDSHEGMAAAWQRLSTGTGTAGDMSLLRREAAEAWFMRKHGPGYNAAHEAAQRRYPSGL